MNRLAHETSPYLLLHKDNPVDWWPWGKDALAAAQAQNKPILLSIGYSACHWCHVMETESFSDPAIASQMNDNYINIKVDREERPDIDQLYQAAANLMGHNGGWPLTVVLTPKAVPFFAGTYFPKEERAGQIPFAKVLSDLTTAYKSEGSQVEATAARVMMQLENLWHRDMKGPIQLSLDAPALRFGQRYDIFFGGMNGTTKFPSVSVLEVLWRAYLRTGLPQFLQLTTTTLDHILLGGLCDHIGGGFFRYCTEERWLVPHFEKMLNDNAALVELMTSCWQFNRNNPCRDRVAETIGWMLRDMKVEDGFATSLDADSEGEEGRFYTWSEAEIDATLKGTFVQKFKQAYNVHREGLFRGKNILQRIGSPAPYPQSEADETLLKTQRNLLLRARSTRTMPARDDKVLADWNGLAISALATAGAVFQNAQWTTAAIRAFDFVVTVMGDGNRLHHSWREGTRGAPGFADDYAHMSRAALILFEKVGDKRFLEQAKTWVRVLNEQFWDSDNGAYFFTANDADSLIVRARMMFDQPTHSANGRMLEVLARLFMTTGEKEYSDRATTLIGSIAGELQRAYLSMASVLTGFEYAASSLQIVVVGPITNPKTHELISAIHSRPLPDLCLNVVSPDESFPQGHPMHGKTLQNGQPTAYICQRGTCSAPITNPVVLSQMLQLPRGNGPGMRLQ